MFYQMFYLCKNTNKSHRASYIWLFSSSVGCIERQSLLMFGEHDTLNVGVVGSSPTGTTDKRSITDGLSIALFLCAPKIEQGWFPRQAQIQYPQTTIPSVCVPFSVSMLRMEHHPGDLPSIYCPIHTECTRGSIIARAGRSDFGRSSAYPQRIKQLFFDE